MKTAAKRNMARQAGSPATLTRAKRVAPRKPQTWPPIERPSSWPPVRGPSVRKPSDEAADSVVRAVQTAVGDASQLDCHISVAHVEEAVSITSGKVGALAL
jgi:hypothetical protein